MKIENKKQLVKMWGMFVKLMTMMPPMMGVQRAAPKPCHEIMNNALHEQLLRPHSNIGLLKIMQNITILMLQEVNLQKKSKFTNRRTKLHLPPISFPSQSVHVLGEICLLPPP